MSAFIVSKATMDLALAAIDGEQFKKVFCGRPIYDCDKLTALGRELFALNFDAVEQRYPGETTDTAPGPCDRSNIHDGYRYSLKLAGDVAKLKALQCLIYQCSEGNVPETDLYKALQDTMQRLAYKIISHLPEYQAAKWDS